MISVCEHIKHEASEAFDNFITQVILPNDDEIKGIQEHNRSDFNFFVCLRVCHDVFDTQLNKTLQ